MDRRKGWSRPRRDANRIAILQDVESRRFVVKKSALRPFVLINMVVVLTLGLVGFAPAPDA